MKKTLAILLSLALLITAIPFATAMANSTYTTAADFYTTSNWVGTNISGDGSTFIDMTYLRFQERTFAMTLKANTTYTLSFKLTGNWGENGAGKLYIGDTLKVYQTDDTAKTDIVASKTGHEAWLAFDATTVITMQFTTGAATGYTLYFKGNWQTDNAGLGGKFTNFALTEHVPPTDLENATEAIATKFTGTQYASIRAKDEDAGKAQGLRVRSDIDTSVLGDAALEDCTVVEYGTLVAKTENLGGAAMTIDMVGTEKKVVKGVAYNTSGTDVVYKLDGTTKSFTLVLINIPVERFVTSYSYRAYAIIEDAEGNQATVYGGATVPVSVESVATDIVNSGTATAEDKAAAQTALDEYAAYEATLVDYTTTADFYNLDNYVTSNNRSNLSGDGSTYTQLTYAQWQTITFSATLKPNTTYTFTFKRTGTSATTGLIMNKDQFKIYAANDSTKTDIVTTANKTGNYGWHCSTTTSPVCNATFTTGAETEYIISWNFSSCSDDAAGVKFTNFALAEVAE